MTDDRPTDAGKKNVALAHPYHGGSDVASLLEVSLEGDRGTDGGSDRWRPSYFSLPKHKGLNVNYCDCSMSFVRCPWCSVKNLL